MPRREMGTGHSNVIWIILRGSCFSKIEGGSNKERKIGGTTDKPSGMKRVLPWQS
jgi:hypothetical protein